MDLYAGTYERFLFRFALEHEQAGASLRQASSQPAHRSAVKCIASSGDYVATGGSDDQIHLLDVARDRDLGFLVNPVEGPVPCLAFVAPDGARQPSHFLTGSVSGAVSIWNARGEWEHIKLLKGHTAAVNAIAVHPTGTVALSTSRDRQMRLWDLVKGACAYQAPLGAEGEAVTFLPGGERYALATGTAVSLHTIKGNTTARLKHERRVLVCQPANANTVVTGCEGGGMYVWDTRKATQPLASHERVHSSRVRSLCTQLAGSHLSAADSPAGMLATASSDGAVKVWSLAQACEGEALAPLAQVEVGARFTCMCAVDGARFSAADGGALQKHSSRNDISDHGAEAREAAAVSLEQRDRGGKRKHQEPYSARDRASGSVTGSDAVRKRRQKQGPDARARKRIASQLHTADDVPAVEAAQHRGDSRASAADGVPERRQRVETKRRAIHPAAGKARKRRAGDQLDSKSAKKRR